MTKLLAAGAALAAGLGGLLLFLGSSEPPMLEAIRVERGDLDSVLSTNGRIEAGDARELFAETSGRVLEAPAVEGEKTSRGAVLVRIDDAEARAEREQARARLAAARAERAGLERGAGPAERARLAAQARAAESRRKALLADLETTRRLVEKRAAPPVEISQLERKIAQAEGEAELARRQLELRASPEDRERAEARVREAEAALGAAERRVGSARVRSPIDGTVYSLPVRAGAYVRPGDRVARVGSLESARVRIWIDEPELGRVSLGDAVTISADGFPAERWSCRIARLPSEIVELGARRVGEARCTVDENAEKLVPNLTVNVEILTASARNALIVPREALIREAGESFVWMLAEDSTARRTAVRLGVRGATRVEVVSGLDDGDTLLIPATLELVDGLRVRIAAR